MPLMCIYTDILNILSYIQLNTKLYISCDVCGGQKIVSII